MGNRVLYVKSCDFQIQIHFIIKLWKLLTLCTHNALHSSALLSSQKQMTPCIHTFSRIRTFPQIALQKHTCDTKILLQQPTTKSIHNIHIAKRYIHHCTNCNAQPQAMTTSNESKWQTEERKKKKKLARFQREIVRMVNGKSE